MTLPPLTRRQHQLLEFFQEYTRTHGISPTLEEMAQHFGLSKVTVFGHVAELERKGVLKRHARNISRGLQLHPDVSPPETPEGLVPVLGTIAAGRPIEANETNELLSWSDWVPSGKEVYVLRVRGNSMIEDAICDGDLVLVEHRSDARDGETVVAVLPGEEATLKRFYREADGFRLQPANAAMEPIHTRDLEVRGVVLGVLRKY